MGCLLFARLVLGGSVPGDAYGSGKYFSHRICKEMRRRFSLRIRFTERELRRGF